MKLTLALCWLADRINGLLDRLDRLIQRRIDRKP